MLLAASTQRTIGFVILAIVFIGGLVYLFFNIRAAKAEVGSEIELAANRAPELRDEDLEGRRLDLALFANLVMLTIIAVALPFYWLGEPGREDGRNVDTDRIFTNRGEGIYNEGAECVNCHGAAGAGGSVTTSITDDDGGFVAQVVWKAPALDTVLSRFSEDEILHTLNFGRNGVMPAWGSGGGGPLTDQQLEEVMYYIRSIQIDEEDIRSQVESGVLTAAEEYVLEDPDGRFGDAYLVELRAAQADLLEATLAAEERDVNCVDFPGETDTASRTEFLEAATEDDLIDLDVCDTFKVRSVTATDLGEASADQLRADAVAFLAEAQAVRATAEMLALDGEPELADAEDPATGENLPLRWATLELLSDPDSTIPNIESYRRYGEFLFANPAASGTYSCARCHTYGWSFDAAERFTIRANGTTESILPDGYEQGGGFFGERLTGESTSTQFETARTHAQFIEVGQTIGQTFGRAGSGGNGQMPGFGPRVETDAAGPTIASDDEFPYPALLTSDQIDAIVAFERTLS